MTPSRGGEDRGTHYRTGAVSPGTRERDEPMMSESDRDIHAKATMDKRAEPTPGPWDLNTLTIAEAEALFAEPLPNPSHPDDLEPFCEPELIAVYRRVFAYERKTMKPTPAEISTNSPDLLSRHYPGGAHPMTAHTPESWRIERFPRKAVVEIRVRSHQNPCIAIVDTEEHARLIASAPDLLAFVEDLADPMGPQAILDGGGNDTPEGQLQTIIDRARTAISAARLN